MTIEKSFSRNDAIYSRSMCHDRPWNSLSRDPNTKVFSVAHGPEIKDKAVLDKVLDKTIRRVKRFMTWDRLKVFFPTASLFQPHPTVDQIVGMSLHCFVLSVLVLAILFLRILVACLRFACYLIMNVTIYRGRVTDQVTGDELRAATIFRAAGLALVITAYNRRRQTVNFQQEDSGIKLMTSDIQVGQSDSMVTFAGGKHMEEPSESSSLTHIFSGSSTCI